jgi:secreted trypsin-like serine protease
VPNAQPLIRGGELAAPGQLPSLAFVAYIAEVGRAITCSGTVVSPWLVLTAAHCAEHRVLEPWGGVEGFRVVTGSVDWRSPDRQVLKVSKSYVPFNYSSWNGNRDVALLRLETPTTAPPIPLAAREFWKPGARAVIAGWGVVTPHQGPVTRFLHRAETFVRRPAWCRERAPHVAESPTNICAGGTRLLRTATCPGDSGGPLLSRRPDGRLVEIGVLSGGYCRAGSPLWFSSVPDVYPWFRRILMKTPGWEAEPEVAGPVDDQRRS